MSREADALWADFWESRRAAGDFDLVAAREGSIEAGETAPQAVGASYRRTSVAGAQVVIADPDVPRIDASIIWIHGGAFTMMSADTHRHVAGHLAVALGGSVVVPEYPLAPEHPFPAALDVVDGVVAELVSGSDEPWVLVGDSAGGALALGSSMRRRDRGEPPPTLTVLLCPWLDLSLSGESVASNAGVDAVLDAETLPAHAAMYLGATAGTDPLASPLHGDLSYLGSVYVQAAEHDVLVDDSVRFARRTDGIEGTMTRLEIVSGLPHCFQFFAGMIPEADAAITRVAGEIRRSLLNREENGAGRNSAEPSPG
ncbi:MAG: alpha/beta hydrolase [Actinomycetota bacterium]